MQMAVKNTWYIPRVGSMEGIICMGGVFFLFPLLAYSIGVLGIIAAYFVVIGCIILLYVAQLFLSRSARLSNPELADAKAPFSLKGRHVLITGGSKGIGYAIAREAVKKGAKLVTLVARDASALQEAQNKCVEIADELGLAVTVQTVSADLVDPTAAIECLDRAVALKVIPNFPNFFTDNAGVSTSVHGVYMRAYLC